VGVVALGALGGLVLPLGVWATSAVLGGGASMNGAALTAFFFPLALAYAVLQADLFEIDVVVRRATTYTIVVAVTAAVYVGLLALAEALRVRTDLQRDPVLLVASNVALLFLLAPIRDRVQDVVDGIFFRRSYDPQQAVARLGIGLERALQVREVVATTRRVLAETFFPRRALLLAAHGGCLTTLAGEPPEDGVELPEAFAARLASGQVLARYAWEDGSGRAIPAVWTALDAELLVPVRRGELLEYVLVLAGKESGRAYNLHDSALLKTIAGQVSLAMATASAFEKLESMNARLEGEVAERTKELGRTNAELRVSLDELNEAYFRLEQSQKSLLRADRLATLGRLAAGIAHEINTPLAAVRNSLALLHGLGREYADSIDDAQVTPDDHRQIAGEIVQTVATAETWAQRAAASIGRIKTHGREPGARTARRFLLGDALAEVAALLEHRLRAVGCRLEIDEETRAVALVGDVGELTHALLNVVDNAIGAYEDLPAHDGRIELRAREQDGAVVLTVRDWATGVPDAVAPHVFDEMFTTKERGKGTGLGLWIARNIVEKSFSGALDLVPVEGRGACFRARLALAPPVADVVPAVRDAATGAAAAQRIVAEGRTQGAAAPENHTPVVFGR
jgi:signal transduction histidine kinase